MDLVVSYMKHTSYTPNGEHANIGILFHSPPPHYLILVCLFRPQVEQTYDSTPTLTTLP